MTCDIVSFDDSTLRDLMGDNIGVEVLSPSKASVQSGGSGDSYMIGLSDRWQKVAKSSKKSEARRSCHIDVSGDEVVEIALGYFEDEDEADEPVNPTDAKLSASTESLERRKSRMERRKSIVRTLVTSLSPKSCEMEDIALTPPAPPAEAPVTMEENQDVSRKSAWRTFSWRIATTASHSTESISWDDTATFDDDDNNNKENDKLAGKRAMFSRWRRKNETGEIDPSKQNLSPLANKDEENVLASSSRKSFSPIPKLSSAHRSRLMNRASKSKKSLPNASDAQGQLFEV
mmetsp:Transcript_9779/g.14396  ORF Transcript_9779/g.14396 Transcript_9779/m.14396 type:complete len:289 (-) Transcript_9779:197-1063(-)|eukprot:CAMPEP_0194048394 /NCGR_PEP_ID=MMETSP0009_2-20130614/27148_1 /TAXON_ID=210454 /ORGANISM="Grammatophora oceanica, Strain CCMP 410" /LENGTH=288 /DNA_ID=CAMNT_0038694245 /DNA_START=83 /DNA_END=949 /DNA_ORIENTATION=+